MNEKSLTVLQRASEGKPKKCTGAQTRNWNAVDRGRGNDFSPALLTVVDGRCKELIQKQIF
jgi:hypothetical protein